MGPKVRHFISSLALLGMAFTGPVGNVFASDGLPISEKEFRELAQELAPKVNLFRETWEMDPKAEFYGGTTRDYLFWLKGKFQGLSHRSQTQAVIKKLRADPVIDVREFIIGESDVDIVSNEESLPDPKRFGVRKVDALSPDIFDPKSELGQNELNQGYIPAEKIRLGRDGFQKTPLGDGIGEIYRGKLSVHFADPDVFESTKYAQEGVNHPVLLALRYLRLQAINYFKTHGAGYPDRDLLLDGMDEKSLRSVRGVIESVMDGKELEAHMKKPKFVSWINGSIQKAFRSYTNPTAALELMREFRVELLPGMYKKVEPVNQYVFSKYRDKAAIRKNIADYKVDAATFYRGPEDFFSDGHLYHGTREERAFRDILFQGILASVNGSAGDGLYGVAVEKKSFAEKWGGNKERLLRFPVAKDAKIVDITSGAGLRVWNATRSLHRGDFSKFADDFGIDILKYPYKSVDAFVVKNAAAIGRAEGVHRSVLPLPVLIEVARKEKDPVRLIGMLSVNSVSSQELDLIWDASPIQKKQILDLIRKESLLPELKEYVLLGTPRWISDPEIQDAVYSWLSSKKAKVRESAKDLLRPNRQSASEDVLASLFRIMERLIADPKIRTPDDRLSNYFDLFEENHFTSPIVTRKAVDYIDRNSTQLGDFCCKTAVAYLRQVTLDRSQKKTLLEALERRKSPGGQEVADLAEILYRSGYERERLIANLEKNIDSIEGLTMLLKVRPGHPEYEALALERVDRFTDGIRFGHEHFLDETMPLLALIKKKLPQAKNTVLANFHEISDSGRINVAKSLVDLDLSKAELLKISDPQVLSDAKLLRRISERIGKGDPDFLDKVLWAFHESHERVDDTLPYHSIPLNAHQAESYMEFFNGLPESARKQLLSRISAQLDSFNGKIAFSYRGGGRYEVEKTYALLAGWQHPLPRSMQKRILEDLEKRKTLFGINGDDLVKVIGKMDLELEDISSRVQNLYLSKRLSIDMGLGEFVERFRQLTPKLLPLVKEEYQSGRSLSPGILKTVEAVFQRLGVDCFSRAEVALRKISR